MRRRASFASVLLALVLVTAGCGSSQPGTLTIYGPYVGPEADIFAEVVDAFERETGITATYVGSSNFRNEFQQRVKDVDLPDVVVLPQPALLQPLVDAGHVTPLGPAVVEKFVEALGPAVEGVTSAIPYRFVVKSLVWYRSDVFADRGYEVPSTLDELDQLASRMIADGETPWCSGMDDALATGWWATDWIEDLYLRRAGTEAYNLWSQLETPFADQTVVDVMQEFQDMVQTDDAFRGGSRGLLTTAVSDAMDPMFRATPGCLMHKQASFEPIWFPPGAAFGEGGIDIFPLPSVDGSAPPIVISGEFVVATSPNPAAQQFLSFLLDVEAFEPWLAEGGSISLLNERAPTDEGSLDARLYEIADAAPEGGTVFDASDQMPGEVGTGSFFRGMIDLVGGAAPESVAAEIQAAASSEPSASP